MKRTLTAFAVLLAAACAKEYPKVGAAGGNAARGKSLVESRYSCTACHTIPGAEGPKALVGPPLEHMASRQILAGRLQNTPENMVRWLRDPQSVEPGTAMPNMNVDEKDARDITAFLYTLK